MYLSWMKKNVLSLKMCSVLPPMANIEFFFILLAFNCCLSLYVIYVALFLDWPSILEPKNRRDSTRHRLPNICPPNLSPRLSLSDSSWSILQTEQGEVGWANV